MARSVGATIARKRQQAKPKKKTTPRPPPPAAAEPPEERAATSETTPSSWRVFMDGALIYVACVLFPTILGFLVRIYTEHKDRSVEEEEPATTTAWSVWQYATDWVQVVTDETESYLCTSSSDVGVTQSWADYAGVSSWICPSSATKDDDSVLLSPDAQWSDLTTVASLCLLLAVVRLAILYILVPLEEPHRLSAVIRCKSVHLLSRDYPGTLTPHGTPVAKRKALSVARRVDYDALQVPDIGNKDDQEDGHTSHLGLSIDDDSKLELRPEQAARSTTGTETDLGPDNQNSSTTHKDTITSTTALEEGGFNSAPRLATASFRLLYSGIVTIVAYIYFSNSEFWPIYVGGKGQTSAAWDLSGGLSLGVDGDYDMYNNALRKFYLCQSAYHWHSGAFHILSVLMLTLRPPERQPGWIQWIHESSSSYQRSFLQHSVAVLLLSITYVFSSLRRLGVIGMFAFDASSFFLHLLQVCLNSPANSLWHSPGLSIFVYRFFVLPSFVYCRFVVWPILWWSAYTESENWLHQLDRILIPGSALALQCLWHTCMFGAMALNSVYLQRLWNHPHLNRILNNRKAEI